MRRAATLVELLVVAGVIALLAGLVFVGVSVVPSRVRFVSCRARLASLYVAIKQYTADWNGYLPIVHVPESSLDPGPGLASHFSVPHGYPLTIPNPPEWYGIRHSLGDYVDDPRLVQCPAAGRDYIYNWTATGLRLSEIVAPLEWSCIACCPGPPPHRLGGRKVCNRLYLDGHIGIGPQTVFSIRTLLPGFSEELYIQDLDYRRKWRPRLKEFYERFGAGGE